ncbi:glycoside hydrolase family 16 protein [Larkinella sp. GY13]|uniref:glycoside hydrolase family 16 protein n=1 Tax=Larkinella sp. GY13 TaxID=3453720 RepID=UPI003EEBB1F0
MKKIILFAFLGWSCANPGTRPLVSGTAIEDSPLAKTFLNDGYQAVWRDEFDGTSLDLTKWEYRQLGAVRNLGRVAKETVRLDGKGNLLIELQKVGNEYRIGQLGTEKFYKTKYGYFECRARMNHEPGPHVAFWLQTPTMGKVIGDPVNSGVEIDIFEYHRKEPATIHHNLHWDGYGSDHKTAGKKITVPAIETGFHTFGLLWTEKEYVFYVDNQETWRTATAVSQTDEYLLLSLELTGWGGDPALATLPDDVAYDYVRVYQKK